MTESKQIANAFKKFLVSIGPQLARGLAGDTNPMQYVKPINNSMVMLDVTTMEVKNVINSLKNASPGPDEFPAFVGKECLESIIEPLTHLINFTFRSGDSSGGFLIRRSTAIRWVFAGFLRCDSCTIMKSFLKKLLANSQEISWDFCANFLSIRERFF